MIKLKKIFFGCLVCMGSILLLQRNVQADEIVYRHQWVQQGDSWLYYDDDGKRCLGWTEIDGKMRYITDKGAVINNFIFENGKWYYFDADGVSQRGKWLGFDNDETWVWFDDTGARCFGWTEIDGKMRYITDKGAVINNFIFENGKWYYFDADGVSQRGKWLGFDNDETWVWFDDTGARCFGWTEVDGKMRYITDKGAVINNFIFEDDKWYYFDADGVSQRGKWLAFDDGATWCYFDDTGARCFGWTEIDGKTYYIDEKGAVKNTKRFIDGKWYEFDSNGVVVSRVYQNPPQYYQIRDSIGLLGGGYNLDIGYEGLKVAWVKKALGLGDSIGLYGALYTNTVANHVRTFQRNVGLPQTGVVDIFTWKAMGYSEADWFNLGAYVSPIRVNKNSTREEHIEAMISRAYDYLGTSYMIGASGAPGTGVDCSGLAMQALYAAGIDMSPINPVRHSYPGYEYESANMWASSKFKHVSYKDRQRGDLIFYQNSKGVVIHVAIYLGNDQVIESTCAPFDKVVIEPLHNSYRSNVKGVVRPFV